MWTDVISLTKDIASVIVTAGAAIPIILVLFKKARSGFHCFLKKLLYSDYSKELVAISNKIDVLDDKFSSKLQTIEHELLFNEGSSIKDAVTRLEAYRRHSITNSVSLQLEVNRFGAVTLVTKAICDLLGVMSEADILGGNWKQFIYVEDYERIHGTLCKAVKNREAMRVRLNLVSMQAEARGEWYLRIFPVQRSGTTVLLYICQLSPSDDIAKDLCSTNNWK